MERRNSLNHYLSATLELFDDQDSCNQCPLYNPEEEVCAYMKELLHLLTITSMVMLEEEAWIRVFNAPKVSTETWGSTLIGHDDALRLHESGVLSLLSSEPDENTIFYKCQNQLVTLFKNKPEGLDYVAKYALCCPTNAAVSGMISWLDSIYDSASKSRTRGVQDTLMMQFNEETPKLLQELLVTFDQHTDSSQGGMAELEYA